MKRQTTCWDLIHFLDSFYAVYERCGRERPTQMEMAIMWGSLNDDDRALRKKVRQASMPGLKLTHTGLVGYCRVRKWKDAHPSSNQWKA